MLYDAKNPIKTFNCYFIMRLSNFRVCFKQLIAGRCCNKSSNTVNDSVTTNCSKDQVLGLIATMAGNQLLAPQRHLNCSARFREP